MIFGCKLVSKGLSEEITEGNGCNAVNCVAEMLLRREKCTSGEAGGLPKPAQMKNGKRRNGKR